MIHFSVSNIGWTSENDQLVYNIMRAEGFSGLEIAPTRIFPDRPYDNMFSAKKWKEELYSQYGLTISSMQSIWYGRSELIFGTNNEREILISYTKKAIDFAEIIGCENLVFGCPRNRSMPEGGDVKVAVDFFRTLGDYAYNHHTVIAMEANPPIYNTNFLNTTLDAINFVEKVDSKGVLLNLDLGTMIENGEEVDILREKESFINHVHISEPHLKPIQRREIHKRLANYLRDVNYDRFVSIEVGKQDNIGELEAMMNFVHNIFS